jgi:catecholate siderophore receptor
MTHAKAIPSFLALTCFGLAAAPALAQDGAQEADQKRLGGGTVTATAIDEPGIKADKVASPKFTQKLQDTPQTIQVITKDLFNQQGATTLSEALRNSPGVGTFSVGENGNTRTGDAIYMRGFDTSTNIYVDGIRDLGSISRDIFNTDQVEVIKGPAGTDYGRGNPSGSINMSSKQANTTNALSALASIGSADQKRISVDINQAIDAIPNTAFRLNAMWQDSGVPGRDHVRNKRFGIAPSIGFGLDTQTRAWLNLLYVKQDNVPDTGVSIVGVPGWTAKGTGAKYTALVNNPVSIHNFYGTRADHDDVEAYMATARFEHDFSDSITLTNIARWGTTRQKYLTTSFMQPTATDVNDLSTYTVARNSNRQDSKNEILTDQLNLRADFSTGSIEHNLSVGVEFTREKQTNYNNIVSFGGSATARPVANLLNPNWNDQDTVNVYRNQSAPVLNRGQTDTQSFYVFDTAKFFDGKVLVTGGIRVDHYKTKYEAVAACTVAGSSAVAACGPNPVGTFLPSVDLSDSGTLFNWKLGVVYKPIEDVSLYANYAISQQPPGGSAFTLTSAAGVNSTTFKPQVAKTIEAGVKWSALAGKLAVDAAVFQTTNTNEVFTDPLDATDLQAGKRRVRGFEITAVGNITDAWAISAGYTHLDAKIAVGTPNTSTGSSGLIYTPGDSASLWTTYNLPFGLELGGGLRYNAGLLKQSDGGDANGTPPTTKGYVVVDATAGYALTDNIKLRVNVTNLFDKRYIAAINKSGYRYTPGAPRAVLFTADFRF